MIPKGGTTKLRRADFMELTTVKVSAEEKAIRTCPLVKSCSSRTKSLLESSGIKERRARTGQPKQK